LHASGSSEKGGTNLEKNARHSFGSKEAASEERKGEVRGVYLCSLGGTFPGVSPRRWVSMRMKAGDGTRV